MSLVRFKAKNHPQQVGERGADELTDDRATDPEFFTELDEVFHFTLDVCATPANTKCERFFDKEQDGLSRSWEGERVWCNPPYSDIAAWVEKAWREHAELIVMLLPANRTEQRWWQDHVEPYRDRPGSCLTVRFLRGRLRFIQPGQREIRPNDRPPFGCCLLIWGEPS